MPAPYFDYAALAPEIILTVAIVVVLVADLLFEEREKYQTSTIAGLGCLAALPTGRCSAAPTWSTTTPS
jgi:hypothetical protein